MMRVIPYASINYAAHETLSRVRCRAWVASRRTLQLSRQGASPARVNPPAPRGRVQRVTFRSPCTPVQRWLA